MTPAPAPLPIPPFSLPTLCRPCIDALARGEAADCSCNREDDPEFILVSPAVYTEFLRLVREEEDLAAVFPGVRP